MEGEKIRIVGIEEEMKESYLDYAMSVIIGRALPDVRDGLKPVHRRILYGMLELGLEPGKPFKKSARIVGEVMGKYHPHGDAPIYESIARMAQTFSLRYPLIEGQGNFGSIDGDPPAAMRYTEARLAPITMEMLADIEKETVEFVPNFDESLMEPTVLPSKVPNLLINGSSGIAVGMATNIPPHNLSEVIDALIKLIDNPEISIEELMEVLPGPDFPTGGMICGREGIKNAYTTGKGIIILRGHIEVEQEKNKLNIVIKSIPFEVNKANLVEEIANLIENGKIGGVSEVRDESDKSGIRVVLETKKGENVDIIINQLYKHTQLQTSYGIINLALVNRQPRLLNIKEMLQLFIEFREEIVIKRTKYELRKAEERYHILLGLIVALDNLDKTIDLIRNSKNVEEAKEKLIKTFKITEIQANAILSMTLSRLTGLEREKILKEKDEIELKIKEYKEILESQIKVKEIIKNELLMLKEKFGDKRKTEIVEGIEEFEDIDLIRPEDIVVTISYEGYIKRTTLDSFRRQRRGGKGLIGASTKEEDFIKHLFLTTTTDTILFFSNKGKVYWLKGYLIPEGSRMAKGKPIINLLRIEPEEKISAVIPVKEFSKEKFLIMITKNGLVKKTSLEKYSKPRKGGIIGIGLKENDKLIDVKLTDGNNHIILSTKKGLIIRFSEKEVRPVGRDAVGVVGIRFKRQNDEVVSCEIVKPEEENMSLLTVCEKGYGKRTLVKEYKVQHRGGKGVIDIKTGPKNGEVVGSKLVSEQDEIIITTKKGIVIRIRVSDIRIVGRNTIGVKLINLPDDDKITDITKVEKENNE
ncbi:MAG: DNA gyrase subunit A [Candidatus Omnitrophica bacterium]|nr:DNA gyrase subunit A [Candidatus Omnitrophota bacterium]MCM8809119.1 DNA gyrase subunit A [Candidatus Omnitrophota bacterium]